MRTTIQALLAECEEEARRQGLKGTFDPQSNQTGVVEHDGP